MKKLLSALLFTVAAGSCAYAQTPRVYPKYTVQQIQQRSQQDLANCQESSIYFRTGGATRDTVRVGGIVVTPGNQAITAKSANNPRRQVWIRSGSGPWSGLGIIVQGNREDLNNLLPQIDGLIPGDSIIVTGIVDEFNGETQIDLIANGLEVSSASGSVVPATLLSVGDLSDVNRNNVLTTGEQWEGSFVEIRNVTVVDVNAFNPDRFTFDVADGEGNRIRINDRFLAGRTPENNPEGTFIRPAVGDRFNSIKGIVIHDINACPGKGRNGGFGYTIDPFDATHYERGAMVPTISALRRNVAFPSATTGVNVTATITHRTLSVANATLHYAVGEDNNTYTTVPMTRGTDDVYTGTIPAQAEGSFVKYYVSAVDTEAGTANVPNVTGGSAPQFFVVRNGLLTLTDVQYTPYTNGTSGFTGFSITVEGIVTSTVNDLGQVFIQQEGVTSWGAISAVGNENLSTLALGDRVRITGTVQDGAQVAGNFNFTRLNEVTAVERLASGVTTITPLVIPVTALSGATAERYESMLVKIEATGDDSLFVVHTNPNATGTSNFGDYRIGTDLENPNEGTIILAGRRDNNVTSSLSVPYVNHADWATRDGEMSVAPIVMTRGTSVESITGIVNYSFNYFKIFPRMATDVTGVNVVTSLASAVKNARVSLYPNPNNGVFTLEGFETGKGLTAVVWDLSGRRVVSQSILSGQQAVNVSSLRGGMYLLTVQDTKGTIVYRNKVSVVK
jgi:hypothetical protein